MDYRQHKSLDRKLIGRRRIEINSKIELHFVEISTDQSLKVTTFGEISTAVGDKQRGIGEFSTTIPIAHL